MLISVSRETCWREVRTKRFGPPRCAIDRRRCQMGARNGFGFSRPPARLGEVLIAFDGPRRFGRSGERLSRTTGHHRGASVSISGCYARCGCNSMFTSVFHVTQPAEPRASTPPLGAPTFQCMRGGLTSKRPSNGARDGFEFSASADRLGIRAYSWHPEGGEVGDRLASGRPTTLGKRLEFRVLNTRRCAILDVYLSVSRETC